MPRYYCDYCDTYLTHDSPSVRKQHNAGYKHKANIRTYYQQFEAQQNQILIDQRIKEHLGQAAAFQQVGAPYNPMRPRLPVLPTPGMPMAGNPQLPMNPSFGRPPVLPRPPPGYTSAPGVPQMVAPPGSAPFPGQFNGLPGPPPPPTMGGPPTMTSGPAMYQPTSSTPTTGGIDNFSMSAQAPEANDQ